MSVEIRPVGLASCGSLAWRYRGQLRVTAIVKASFAFVPGGTMRLEPPDDLHLTDVPWGARQSLWAASDLVPFRLLADVVLVGHAYLPPGGGVVRLAVLGDAGVLVDRSLGVSDDVGDGAPVSLSYERAFGGPGSADNPVGTGSAAGSSLPALIDVAAPRHPGGFGPVARSWPARARRLGSTDAAVLAGPIAEVPSGIDWGYFQAAPPGQITDFLRGDERVEIDGMSRAYPVLRTRLPGVTAAGRVYGLPTVSGRGVPIAFRADDLHLDADRMRCSLTWRASFSVPGEDLLPELVLLAGIELAGETLSFPEKKPPPRAPAPPRPPQPSLSDLPTYVDTVPLRVAPGALPAVPSAEPPPAIEDEDSQLELETIPFRADPPPGPFHEGAASGRQGTMLLEWPGEAAPAPPAARQPTMLLEWPLAGGDAPGPAGRQPTMVLDAALGGGDGGGDEPLLGTLPFSADHLPAPMSSPFRLAEPGAPSANATSEIAGAPWAARRAAPVARSFGGEVTRSLVLDPRLIIPDDLLPDQAAPPRPPPPPVAAPAPPPPVRPVARSIARPSVKPSVRARFAPRRG